MKAPVWQFNHTGNGKPTQGFLHCRGHHPRKAPLRIKVFEGIGYKLSAISFELSAVG